MASAAMPRRRSERLKEQKRKRAIEDDGEESDHEDGADDDDSDVAYEMAEDYKNLHADSNGHASTEVRGISHKMDVADLIKLYTVFAKPLEMVYAPSAKRTDTGIAIMTYRTLQLAKDTVEEMDGEVTPECNDDLPMSVKQCLLLDRSNPAQVRARLGLTKPGDDWSEQLPPQGVVPTVPPAPVLQNLAESSFVTVSNIGVAASSEDIIRYFRINPLPVVIRSRSTKAKVQTACLVFDSAATAEEVVHRFQGRFWPEEFAYPMTLHQH